MIASISLYLLKNGGLGQFSDQPVSGLAALHGSFDKGGSNNDPICA
jgi:hypothetical protein